jgi:hypothetical protein
MYNDIACFRAKNTEKDSYQFSTKIPEPVFFFMFPLGNPHTKPRRFFPKNCPGHPPKQPTTQQSFFHLRLPGPTASATLTVGSCKHSGQDIHTHAERWALWPGLKRADSDWGAEDIFPAPPLPGTKKGSKSPTNAPPCSPIVPHNKGNRWHITEVWRIH